MGRPGPLRTWIEALPSRGRYSFSKDEARAATPASAKAVEATLRRLLDQRALARPRGGFYVVVPPEYRNEGSPPASWFIDDFMRHLGRRYYVALLTAAAHHGAGHQQPMVFQVIADAPEREILVGRVRIEIHSSILLEAASTERVQTETGTMAVSTPETTAFDLVRFPAAAGSWSHVATVIAELAEKLDSELLAAGAQRVARTEVQRLGWLLDLIGERALADRLAKVLEGQRLAPTPLDSRHDAAGAQLERRWRILVNYDVEPDL